MRKENTWDAMNLAWSLNPNKNFDVTYFRFKESAGGLLSKLKKKKNLCNKDNMKGKQILKELKIEKKWTRLSITVDTLLKTSKKIKNKMNMIWKLSTDNSNLQK